MEKAQIRALRLQFENKAGVNLARWIPDEEGEWLREVTRLSGASVVYESGTANGYSALWLASGLPKAGVVHTFDVVDREKCWAQLPVGREINFYCNSFHLGVVRFLNTRPKDQKALFFIDGDHTKEGVTNDIAVIEPHLRKGDTVIFDDVRDLPVKHRANNLVKRIKGKTLLSEIWGTRNSRRAMALFVGIDVWPEADESVEPIVLKIPDEMDWKTSKVKDIPNWMDEKKPWTQYAEKPLLTSSEQHLFYDVGRRLGPGNYANLGVFRGNSVACIAFGLKEIGATGTIYAVDDYTLGLLKEEGHPQKFLDNMQALGLDQYVKVCVGTTEEWGNKVQAETFNFVLIDASHTYVNTKLDFHLWGQRVKVGGEVAFHDVEYTSVDKVIDEALKSPEWELTQHIWRTKILRRVK